MKNLVSIVVPIYNVEKYLQKCIDSITEQTYSNIEIILVDDGATDNSGKICDQNKNKDQRIKVIHKKNGGLSDARNTGIKKATGEYLMFIDSDDYISKTTIEDNMKIMLENNCDVVIFNRFYVFNDRTILRFPRLNKILYFNNLEAIQEMNAYNNFDMSAWGKIYKKDIFEGIEYPLNKTSEDFFIIFKIFEKCNKVAYNSTPYYYYIQRKGSITKNKKINYDFLLAAKEQLNYLLPKYPELEISLKSSYASAAMTIYNSVLKNGGKCLKKDYSDLRKIVKENIKYIKENKQLSKIKKIQCYLFVFNQYMYNLSFKILRKIKKV